MPRYLAQSRPYARSCLTVATKASAQAQWAASLGALAVVVGHPDLARVLSRPGQSADKLAQLVLGAAGEMAPMPTGIDNLVSLLIENRRLSLLGGIELNFRRLWQAQTGRVSVSVRTAYALSDEQRQRLQTALKKRLGAEPDISVSVCPELGAGLVVRTGDNVIDSTLPARLESFARSIAHG